MANTSVTYFFCARTGRDIVDWECCERIVNTMLHDELRICMHCSQGKALAATTIPRLHEGSACLQKDSTRLQKDNTQPRWMRMLFRFLLIKYPRHRFLSVRLVHSIARTHFGYKPPRSAFEASLLLAGVYTQRRSGRVAIVINNIIRELAATAYSTAQNASSGTEHSTARAPATTSTPATAGAHHKNNATQKNKQKRAQTSTQQKQQGIPKKTTQEASVSKKQSRIPRNNTQKEQSIHKREHCTMLQHTVTGDAVRHRQ